MSDQPNNIYGPRNPFKVLNIGRDTSSRGIIQAAASALRTRAYSAVEISAAQKALLDPVTRADAEFLYFIPMDRLSAKYRNPPSDPPEVDPSALNRLTIFD